jgi:hypothetical protein
MSLPTNLITSLPSFEAVPSFRLVSSSTGMSLVARPDGTVFVTDQGHRDWDRWRLTEVESTSTEETSSVFGIHSTRHVGNSLGLGFGQPALRIGRKDDITFAMCLTKDAINSWFTIESTVYAKRLDVFAQLVDCNKREVSVQLVDCDEKEVPLSCRWEPSWIREELCFLWETKTHTGLDIKWDNPFPTAVMSPRKAPLRFTEVEVFDNCFTISLQENGQFLSRSEDTSGKLFFTDERKSKKSASLWTLHKNLKTV